jgi:hypothetical protein
MENPMQKHSPSRLRQHAQSIAGCCTAVAIAASSALALDVNVQTYGAVGNGTTNDRAAIQSAIDAVSAEGGGTVTLPGGFTFLTGTIQLKSNVALTISSNATLKSSTDAAFFPHPVQKGRSFGGSIAWDDKYFWNYPLIFADSGTHDIKIQGQGAIRIGTASDGDDNQIFLSSIGLFKVRNWEISGVGIREGKGYNIQLHDCTNGLIRKISIDQTWGGVNADGISIMNCTGLDIDSCNLRTNDDALYPWSSWDDPRGRTWWHNQLPQQCKNIEIHNNTIYQTTSGAHVFCMFLCGGCYSDLSTTEMENIYVHDNAFDGTSRYLYPAGPDNMHPCNVWGAIKDFTWIRNSNPSNLTDDNAYNGFSGPPYTNLVTDHNPGTWRSKSVFQNPGFETNGITWWSVRGFASAKNDAVGQIGSWYGAIENLNAADTTRIFQGLYLTAGDYHFSAQVQSSGVSARMFVRNGFPADSNLVAAMNFSNTAWSLKSMNFHISSACNYRIGIEGGTAAGGWARIDAAVVAAGLVSVNAGLTNAQALPDLSRATIYDMRGRIVCASSLGDGKSAIMPASGCYFAEIAAGRILLQVQAIR